MKELDGKNISKMISNVLNVSSADSDMKRENANVDADSTMGGMLKIGSEVCKQYALANIFSKYKDLHESGKIHIHDLDFSALTVNCIYIPLGKLLRNGFVTGHGSIRSPRSIGTAANLTCIIIQSSQNDFFGGQGIATFDYDLAPYVGISYVKNIASILDIAGWDNTSFASEDIKKHFTDPCIEYCLQEGKHILSDDGVDFIRARIYDLLDHEYDFSYSEIAYVMHPDRESLSKRLLNKARDLTEQQTIQAMEALVHNLCTMNSRAGAQVPFSSINFGTDTSEEGRMVSMSLLTAIDHGMGNGETAIFPIAIMKLKKGITDQGSPNHDIFQKAARVSARRLYPNFLNLDATYNKKYYREGRPETEAAAMGCLSADSKIIITDKHRRKQRTVAIADFVNDKNAKHYLVWDTLSADFVKIKNVISNPPTEGWVRIETHNSNVIIATEDHYFPVVGKGRISATELRVGDELTLSTKGSPDEPVLTTKIIKLEPYDICEKSYCLETESDRFDANGICVHNCRTRVMSNIHDPDNEVTSGRGNLFVTTINLPYLVLEAKQEAEATGDDLNDVIATKLSDTLDTCFDILDDRFDYISKRKAYNYPFMMGQGLYLGSEKLKYDDTIAEPLKHGTRTIGFIGLAEALVAITGHHHAESEQSASVGLFLITAMRYAVEELSKIRGVNYGLMASPAEGCTGRLAMLTRKKFGVIKGVTDKDYFTNSFHVPPAYPISAYRKVELEAPYHELCQAGCISYIEIDSDATRNIKGFIDLVNYMAESNMGYFSINHPVDRDPLCGYIGYIPHNGVCPRCGRRDGEGVEAGKLLKVQTRKTADARYALSASMFEEEY